MSVKLIELYSFETKLPEVAFTQERSSLELLNSHFSSFENKDFLGWLDLFSSEKERIEVLEVGGGVNLVAAQQLLRRFGNLLLTEVEKRKIDEQVERSLQGNERFILYQSGFSQALNFLKEEKFDIVFLHNVLPHLPDPFFILERCFSLLKKEGLLFVNGILIYGEEWEKIVGFLNSKGFQFSFSQEQVPSELLKKGIISVSLSLRKDQDHNQINFPVRVGDFLTDFAGNKLGPKEFFYQE